MKFIESFAHRVPRAMNRGLGQGSCTAIGARRLPPQYYIRYFFARVPTAGTKEELSEAAPKNVAIFA